VAIATAADRAVTRLLIRRQQCIENCLRFRFDRRQLTGERANLRGQAVERGSLWTGLPNGPEDLVELRCIRRLVGPFGSRFLVPRGPDASGFFVNASVLGIAATTYWQANRFAETGIGYRFDRSLAVHDICSTDYGYTAGGHSVMVRYNFRVGE
jgi:hypothetical protein